MAEAIVPPGAAALVTPSVSGEQAPKAQPVDPAAAQATPGSGSSAQLPESGSGTGSAAKRLFAISVDGETEEIDLADEKLLRERLQKGRHAEKRLPDAARKAAAVEKAMAAYAKDPEGGFEDLAKALGLNPDEVSQKLVARELKRQIEQDELNAMTPEQRKAWQDQKDLEKFRADEAKRAADQKKADEEKSLGEKTQRIAAKLDEAISFGLSDTKLAGDQYAQYIFAAHVQSLAEDVMAGKLKAMPHPKQIAKYVELQIQRLGAKYAPEPAKTPAAPPKHPASKPRTPKTPGVQRTRDPQTGQFTGGFTYGNAIYEGLAKQADKSPRKLGFNPLPVRMPGS